MRIDGDTPLSQLNHNDEIAHAKYTSKKMVNGKWRYTYTTNKNNSLASKFGKASNWKYLSREKINGKWQYTYNKPAAKATATKSTLYDKAKANQTKGNASSTFIKKNTGIANDIAKALKEQKTTVSSNTLYDKAKTNQAKSNISSTSTKVLKEQKNTVAKGLDALKNISNILGLDAREKYKETAQNMKDADDRRNDTRSAYDKTRDDAYSDNKLTKTEKNTIDFAKRLLDSATAQYDKAGIAYIKAKQEYFDTPVGKISSHIEKGSDWLRNTFSSIFNMNASKSYKEDEVAESEREKKGAYLEAQLKERSSIRTSELSSILAKLENNNPLPSLKLKKEATTLDEDMALVNPNYATETNNYDQNCAYCTVAYDLRRRGYDVEAMPEAGGLTSFDIARLYGKDKDASVITTIKMGLGLASESEYIADMFARNDIITSDSLRDKYDIRVKGSVSHVIPYMIEDMLSHGEGARGNLALDWKGGGGHSIVWEIENGKAVFRDCQVNEVIDIEDYMLRVNRFDYMRTDNLELSEDVLKYVRNRKG